MGYHSMVYKLCNLNYVSMGAGVAFDWNQVMRICDSNHRRRPTALIVNVTLLRIQIFLENPE